MTDQLNNPLHGKTLETIVTYLVDHYGWESLYSRIRINCFSSDPSIKSSLTFLRKTPWARKKVEDLYIQTINKEKFTTRFLCGYKISNASFLANNKKAKRQTPLASI